MRKRGVVILIVGVLVAAVASLDIVLRNVVESVGPQLTKSPVSVASIDMRWSGMTHIQNLEIGNPSDKEFDSPFALRASQITVHLQPASVFSDNLQIDEVVVDGVEMCWEGIRGQNHGLLLENIQSSTDEQQEQELTRTDRRKIKKMRSKSTVIKRFRMTNTKLHLYGFGRKIGELELPDYEQQDIGNGAELALGYLIKIIYGDLLRRIVSQVPTDKAPEPAPVD